MPKKKIVIIGGGIAGLGVANKLNQDQFDITIIEKSPALNNKGFTVGLWNNGINAIKKLIPAKFHLIEENKHVILNQYLIANNNSILRESHFKEISSQDHTLWYLNRGTLIEILHKGLEGSVNFIFGAADFTIHQAGRTIAVKDTIIPYDILLGADGMYSVTRNKAFANPHLNNYNGFLCYCQLPFDEAMIDTASDFEFLCNGYFAGLYPNKHHLGLYFSTKDTGIKDDPIKYLQDKLRIEKFFPDMLRDQVKKISGATPVFVDRLVDYPYNHIRQGNIFLIGDAAGGLLPTTGQGINLALEEALVFAEALNQDKNSEEMEAILIGTFRQKIAKLRKRSALTNFLAMNRNTLANKVRDVLIKSLAKKSKNKELEKYFNSSK